MITVGLTQKEAEKRLQTYGLNTIVVKRHKPLVLEFLEEFKDIMVILLIVAAMIAGIAGNFKDGAIILFIVFVNAVIGFIQKYKAERAVEALQKLLSPKARVMRDGEIKEILAAHIVPGDLLVLTEGDCINADGELMEVNAFTTQEATLTGESMPVRKTAEKNNNRVYMGTSVAHGTGKAIVTATGMQTKFGKIARLTTTTKKDASPLQKEFHRIGMFVGKITIAISAILFVVGYTLQGRDPMETLLFAAAVAVAAVPEGLPATITISLALGVQRLAKKNAIVKQLASVETLGSTTVICSDKTGTLTKNEMTVKEIFLDDYCVAVHGAGYVPTGSFHIKKINNGECISLYERYKETQKKFAKEEPELYKRFEYINLTSLLCNNAKLKREGAIWTTIGDPTEGALLTMAEKAGFRAKETQQEWKRIYELPFDSARKRMTVICENEKTKKIMAFIKGAPEMLMPITCNIDEKQKKSFLEENDRMARRALRVMGIAYKELPKKEKQYNQEDVEKDIIFLGLVGMIDPPRENVKEAVEKTHTAGIRTYIVTGDNGLTAAAIAQEVGIAKKNPYIITGDELNTYAKEKLDNVLKEKREIIFARVNPEHKLRIVESLKEQQEIVAVTGDGVNDAPALKRADIGIAMGIAGTDVSREAANMVLADDSFATIITAIEEGRTIYDNLKKFIFFVFSCNFAELMTVFAGVILNIPPPLTAILILLIDLGTDVLPAISLGIDPSEKEIMKRKPRNPKEHIMNKTFIGRFLYLGIIMGLLVVGNYILGLMEGGWKFGISLANDDPTYIRAATMAFALLVLIQMVNIFNARSERLSAFSIGFFKNKYLLGSVIISILFIIALVHIPAIQKLIFTTRLTLNEWGFITLMAFIPFIIEEIRKWVVRLANTSLETKAS